MAFYKYVNGLTQSQDEAFDATHAPGTPAPHSGIYRCISCGNEIAIAKGQILPSDGHQQYDAAKVRTGWKLLVFPISKS